ncbi:virion structural protein [Pseudomonas phage PhL_UNISO_PA-DSM_ph0034]|uniref:Virion structural protein n=1 Tax=Pseudomonas phage PhL_UNISO_PA-DSM_ph0034 TaxID=2812900 RepID=A0A9E6Q7K0_9CAUD|nr:virion structural protein [Pseudomonas phage PhL_UNISO_PA-DSM_ph0034]QYC95291.1 virion structural protein [Pseudomonas phage PhL_UNISO_PA-DSM_ph0034]
MTVLTDVIDIQISRETAAVAQTNFNVPLFIASHTNFSERARVYNSLKGVAEDFGESDPTYLAAVRYFGQALKPRSLVIGRRQVPSATVSVSVVQEGQSYVLTVNGLPVSYVSQQDDTATLIATGLKAAYDVTPVAGVTVTDNEDGTLTVASNEDWSLKVSSNLTMAAAPSTEGWPATITAVQGENDEWYALSIDSHADDDIMAVATHIEGTKKVFVGATAQANTKTSADNDIASRLVAGGFQRTALMYHPNADAQFPECAWVGYQLQEQPGSNTWTHKALAAVDAYRLTPTESTNLKNKHVTTFERVGGVNRTFGGAMAGGEWIDVMIFVDWLEARMTERLWFRMANSKKIPYDAVGATILESEIRAQLNEGIRVGGLAEAPAPKVFVPDVLSMSPNMRAQRIFEGIEFEARLAGAIHFVHIRGTVTV